MENWITGLMDEWINEKSAPALPAQSTNPPIQKSTNPKIHLSSNPLICYV